jgi:transcription initiation factor IIE alpha subunit
VLPPSLVDVLSFIPLFHRQFSSNKKNKEPKFVLDGMKEDYEARLDRLQCPKCHKYQSFDEFLEKRRICGACQERYVKLHVSKFKSWETKQAEHERKKKEKLAKLDQETTGQWAYKPTLTEL